MLLPGTRFSKAKSSDLDAAADHGSATGIVLEPPLFPEVKSNDDGRIRCGRAIAEQAMTILRWALLFFLISIVAGVLGFTGISAASADIARFLFYVFVVIFLVLLILGLTLFRV
jgi:uncharacterized membrane protein YtjA (UPF0391 family)